MIKNFLLKSFIFIMMTGTGLSNLYSADSPGVFDNHSDVGQVKIPGSVSYNPQSQEYTVTGSGTNIWFGRDEFHYLWKKMNGDFILTATMEFVGKGVDPHRKAGWMIRKTLDTGSVHISTVIHGDGLTSLQFRKVNNGDMEEKRSEVVAPSVIQLERKGNRYIMSVARYGEVFTSEEMTDSSLAGDLYVGLFVCSHNPDVSETVIFRNVRITVPVKDDFIPYTDYIGANLEIMDVESGIRKVIYRSPEALQAPNWTTDGKSLIYNLDGRLYNFDLQTEKISEINCDFAVANNNDHVLSFDGKMIGISHHSTDDNGVSIIYTLPVTGDTPKRITPVGPSYLHGWSPDGKYLIYTGGRDGKYNIYKIPVNGGDEIRLTHADALDDGSEYTPDGKYIYFNSNRTGKMQIWRMKPDGSGQEQITSDEYNNWFPHVSPDGKWIVYLAYGDDVKPGDHPYYKHVYIRLMPIAGGESKVIAYLYGGQGTINVPSWSPDSKKIAFVSNSDHIK